MSAASIVTVSTPMVSAPRSITNVEGGADCAAALRDNTSPALRNSAASASIVTPTSRDRRNTRWTMNFTENVKEARAPC